MIVDFFYLVSELKKVSRKGWKVKVGIEYPESVADHSFVTAIMAMIISDGTDLDQEKTIKMALMHDLAESLIGDFMPDEISREQKRIAELDAMKEILSTLPVNLSKSCDDIWQEYIQEKSREATFVHDVDKLEMVVQAAKYSSEGFSEQKLQLFVESARSEIKSKEILAILDTISYK